MVSPLSIVSLVHQVVTASCFGHAVPLHKEVWLLSFSKVESYKGPSQYVFDFHDATIGSFVFLCDKEGDL